MHAILGVAQAWNPPPPPNPQYFTPCSIGGKEFLTQNHRWNKSHKISFRFEAPPLVRRSPKAMPLQYKKPSFHLEMKLKLHCDFAFPTYEWVWACFGGTIQIPNFNPYISRVVVCIQYSQAHRPLSRCSVSFLGLDFKLSKMRGTGSPSALHIQRSCVSSIPFSIKTHSNIISVTLKMEEIL